MTETQTIPDVDNLEDMDFEPRCCIRFSMLGVKGPECDEPAKWVGFTPCCGRAGLVCERHFQTRHTRPFFCSRCPGLKGVHDDLINWRRL